MISVGETCLYQKSPVKVCIHAALCKVNTVLLSVTTTLLSCMSLYWCLLTVLNYVVLIQAEFHRVPQPLQGKQCSVKAHHHVLRNPSRWHVQDRFLREAAGTGAAGTKVGNCLRMMRCTTLHTHWVHLIGHRRTQYHHPASVAATAPRCSAALMQGQAALSAATALIVPGTPAWSMTTYLEPRVICAR